MRHEARVVQRLMLEHESAVWWLHILLMLKQLQADPDYLGWEVSFWRKLKMSKEILSCCPKSMPWVCHTELLSAGSILFWLFCYSLVHTGPGCRQETANSVSKGFSLNERMWEKDFFFIFEVYFEKLYCCFCCLFLLKVLGLLTILVLMNILSTVLKCLSVAAVAIGPNVPAYFEAFTF